MARMARLSTLALTLLAGATRAAGQGAARSAVAAAVRARRRCLAPLRARCMTAAH
jgi:hypothetical protein